MTEPDALRSLARTMLPISATIFAAFVCARTSDSFCQRFRDRQLPVRPSIDSISGSRPCTDRTGLKRPTDFSMIACNRSPIPLDRRRMAGHVIAGIAGASGSSIFWSTGDPQSQGHDLGSFWNRELTSVLQGRSATQISAKPLRQQSHNLLSCLCRYCNLEWGRTCGRHPGGVTAV